MKIFATLLLSLSLPVLRVAPKPRAPEVPAISRQTPPRGTWYLAATGHAVYCYGPVFVIPDPQGQLQRVATFCRDGQTMVPLMD